MRIPIVRDVLEESNARAQENHALLNKFGICTVNLMSSPGSGKTTLLARTISELNKSALRCAVIEGDITSTLDSERLQPLGVPVVQVNTDPFGGDCHVGSHFVQGALKYLELDKLDYLFIENIGNLVCPAEFYLGEHERVVVLSLPEGEDKPLKYPLMFRECNLCLLNKVDLAPHLEVSAERFTENIHKINGALRVISISGKTGEGFEEWMTWLQTRRADHLSRPGLKAAEEA